MSESSARTRRPSRRLMRLAAAGAALALAITGLSLPAQAAEPAAGATTAGDPLFPNVGNAGYDVQNYDIAMTYRTKTDISAVTTITAIAASPLSSFALDFEGLTVESVLVNGTAASYVRENDAAAVRYKLIVTPAQPVVGEFTVAVAYSGAPVRHIDHDGSSEGWVPTTDGVTALGQPVGSMAWFPNNNTPADKATYRIAVTAPSVAGGNPLVVASNGELTSKTVDDVAGTTQWVWTQTKPMASELSVLSIGRFNILESDIVLASGRTLHEWSFVDPTISTNTQNTINTRRASIKPIIDWLETKLGPYPGASTGVIVDRVSVGYALETQDRPFFDGSISAPTLIHELVHQWLGNEVAPADWSHIWLNEGAAEFFTTYYQYATSTAVNPTTPENDSYSSWNSATSSRWTVPTVGFTDPSELYDWQVYNRGKYTLGALMTAIGRQAFDQLYAEWTARHAGGSATTADFIALAEEVSGRDLGAFFQDWLYDTDKPAWPPVWSANASLVVPDGTTYAAGDPLMLKLAVQSTGQVTLTGGKVVVDGSTLLPEITLPTPLPAGLSIEGTDLVWSVPDTPTGSSASLDIPFTIAADSSGAPVEFSISAPGLGSTVTSGVFSFTTAGPVKLTLLNINDFHGRIDANTVKFAGTIETLREAGRDDHTLLLSDGDNIGASLFASSYFNDEPTIDVLNALDLAASAAGNHEFDKGYSDLVGRVSDSADFSYLGANVYLKGTTTPALPEYAVIDVAGLKVAVIGAITQETPALVAPGGISSLDFGDPVAAVNRVAESLEGTVDVIIAEYHEGASAGTPDNATIEQEIAAGGAFSRIVTDTSASVDAIFTGHTHKLYDWDAPVPGTDRTRPVIQTGSYGENIGKVVLEIDRTTGAVTVAQSGNVARLASQVFPNDAAATAAASKALDDQLIARFPRVAEVATIVDETLAQARVVGEQPVGSVTADITTAFAGGSYAESGYAGGSRDNRAAQSTLGNLVADALVSTLADPDRGGAEIGVVNPGGLRAELYEGTDGVITYAEANAVLPFVNNLWTTTLTGAQFTAALEQQWQPEGSSRPYLALGLSSNVSYTFDATKPRGERITGVWIDGQPLVATNTYRVGSFNFLLQGGDNFTAFAQGTSTRDSGLIDRDAWISYLQAHPGLSPQFASRSAQLTGVPASVMRGQTIEFALSSVDLTSLGSPRSTTVTPRVTGSSATFAPIPVTNGTANVSLTFPVDATPQSTIELTVAPGGTTVVVPIQVAAGQTGPIPPTTTPVPATDEQLLAELEGLISVPSPNLVAGETVVITVGTQYAGQWVTVWLHSTPTQVGGWYQVAADGTITVTLPVGVSGSHRLVVLDASGNVIGWSSVALSLPPATGLPASGALPKTGADASWLGGVTMLALLLIGAGVIARVRPQRRS